MKRKKSAKKVVSFFELNFLATIAPPLLGVWKWYLGWNKVCMGTFCRQNDLAISAEFPADFDPYILVIFFKKMRIFTKFGL